MILTKLTRIIPKIVSNCVQSCALPDGRSSGLRSETNLPNLAASIVRPNRAVARRMRCTASTLLGTQCPMPAKEGTEPARCGLHKKKRKVAVAPAERGGATSDDGAASARKVFLETLLAPRPSNVVSAVPPPPSYSEATGTVPVPMAAPTASDPTEKPQPAAANPVINNESGFLIPILFVVGLLYLAGLSWSQILFLVILAVLLSPLWLFWAFLMSLGDAVWGTHKNDGQKR